MDLLLDWQPTPPVVEYEPERVKALSFASTIAKGVSQTLTDCELSREEIAAAMTEYLEGERISKHVLDGYSAESRDDLTISLIRLDALLAVTKDRRLLQLLASRHGWEVIERRDLAAIEMVQLIEHRNQMEKEIEVRRHLWMTGDAS